MDFKEYLIKKQKTTFETFLAVIIYLVAIILAAFMIRMMLALPGFGGIMALLAVGVIYLARLIVARFDKEFEYVQTGEYLDIDVIFSKSRRKRIASASVENMEAVLPADSDEGKRILKSDFVKVIDATTGDKHTDVYYVVFNKNGRNLLKIQPPTALVEEIRRLAPSKVQLKKD